MLISFLEHFLKSPSYFCLKISHWVKIKLHCVANRDPSYTNQTSQVPSSLVTAFSSHHFISCHFHAFGSLYMMCLYVVDPWTTHVWTAWVHLFAVFFFNKYILQHYLICRLLNLWMWRADYKVKLRFSVVLRVDVPNPCIVQGSAVQA